MTKALERVAGMPRATRQRAGEDRRRDVMSVEQRSALMGRIRGKDTGPERLVADALIRRRLQFESHANDLPGTPDFVFRRRRVAVFVDGDFWHGWRFPRWSAKLAPFWREKIAANRCRDRRCHAALRRQGWRVLRVWEHQLRESPKSAIERIFDFVRTGDPTHRT